MGVYECPDVRYSVAAHPLSSLFVFLRVCSLVSLAEPSSHKGLLDGHPVLSPRSAPQALSGAWEPRAKLANMHLFADCTIFYKAISLRYMVMIWRNYVSSGRARGLRPRSAPTTVVATEARPLKATAFKPWPASRTSPTL